MSQIQQHLSDLLPHQMELVTLLGTLLLPALQLRLLLHLLLTVF